MKPVNLKFKGINSFSEETEINFEKLIKNGIFGIFGDTGSGKSTILDCINFALYGKIERSKEKLDIINYRCDVAEVKFEFDVLNEGKRRRYIVERTIRRKSGMHKALLYEDNVCVADNVSSVTKRITEILGVDADDFRKCIALPQGEFAQFVKSQSSERIALIEHLFSLSKYGDRLKERVRNCESECEINYKTLLAKLSVYEDVSQQVIDEIECRIKEFKEKLKESERNLKDCEKNYNSLNSLYAYRLELDKNYKQLTELENKLSEINELRAGLKAAPICKNAVEINNQLLDKKKQIEGAEIKLNTISTEIEEVTEILDGLSLRAQYNYDDKIAQCIALSSKYSACEGKPDKLRELENKLTSKRAEYNSKAKELAKLRHNLALAEDEVQKVKENKLNSSSEDLNRLINVEFKGAILKEEYISTFDYFVGLNGQVKFHKDNSDLYNFMSRELKQQIDTYKDRVLQVKDFNLDEARKKLINFQTEAEEREKISAELNDRLLKLKDAQTDVEKCESEIRIILKDGELLRKQADEVKEELDKIFGQAVNYSVVKAQNEKELKKLKDEKIKMAEDTESANKKLNKLKESKVEIQAEINSARNICNELEKRLADLIKQSGFSNFDECKRLADEFSVYTDAEKAISEFDSQYATACARKKELENIKDIKEVSKEKLSFAEQQKQEFTAQLNKLRESVAVLESDKKKALTRLKEKEQLNTLLKKAEGERNLIYQLKELTKGNKFMEYIANEYLYDISSLASSTLLNLTDGRYFLTYTDNFYVGDNFNCGNLRGVNTLSGGETFLVSLSLALALSQTICSSLKSIEFFFLDEGFGTLDGTLVETVMNALEKLKSSSFTIGIISHVEELKHRIDNKITVIKATENHGSTVKLSC
ncbi:MAG: SMC family ATPase [Clostridia bacterium]|nr:SMC family ATPase [Clostridia bacterium]